MEIRKINCAATQLALEQSNFKLGNFEKEKKDNEIRIFFILSLLAFLK